MLGPAQTRFDIQPRISFWLCFCVEVLSNKRPIPFSFLSMAIEEFPKGWLWRCVEALYGDHFLPASLSFLHSQPMPFLKLVRRKTSTSALCSR